MKTFPHRLAIVAAAALLLLSAFVSGISSQTTKEPSSSSQSSLDKESSKTGNRSYRTASSSERDQDATFAFPQNRSHSAQIPSGKQSSLFIPLAIPTPRDSVPGSASEGIQKRDNEWGIWGGISFDSPTWIGQTPNARFGNIGLRYGRVLLTSKTVAFEWTIDVVPVAFLSNPRFTLILPPGPGFQPQRVGAYGAGAAPIGLKFNFRRNKRVQPFGQATGGFLYFNKQVPEPATSQFNYTFDFSGGVQVVNSNRRSFTIGYKYQHISNGNTGIFNPGVDVQMIFAGFSVFR